VLVIKGRHLICQRVHECTVLYCTALARLIHRRPYRPIFLRRFFYAVYNLYLKKLLIARTLLLCSACEVGLNVVMKPYVLRRLESGCLNSLTVRPRPIHAIGSSGHSWTEHVSGAE